MEAITRTEKLLSGQQLEPFTRKEMFLAKMAGMDVKTPTPYTREEMFMQNVIDNGGGSGGGWDGVYSNVNNTDMEGYDVGVGKRFFRGNAELKTVEIVPCAGVSEEAFSTCPNLESVNLSTRNNGVGGFSVEKAAFVNCKNLKSVSLRNVAKIGERAFFNNAELKKLLCHYPSRGTIKR